MICSGKRQRVTAKKNYAWVEVASLGVSFYRRAFHMFLGMLGMYNLY